MNPHKWKKYSLSDADTSDRTNTAAAFEFLKEIEARKRDHDMTDDMDTSDASSDGKIVFKQRRRIADGSSSAASYNLSTHLKTIAESGAQETEKPVLRGSKVLMPEYVIGQKVRQTKEKPKKSGGKSNDANQLKLGHLFEDDVDE